MPDLGEGLPREFAVEPDPLNGVPGVLVRGELDVDTAPRLTRVLDREIRASVGPFIVDLCDLDFLDSSGVNVLVRARALLGREDRELVVICPPGDARRIFEMTNLAELLVLFDSREQAAASLRTVA
jgi:anti-anti-sigma factor